MLILYEKLYRKPGPQIKNPALIQIQAGVEMRQAISWKNNDHIYWSINASLGPKEINHSCNIGDTISIFV